MDQALKRTRESLDRQVGETLANTQSLLERHGGTAQEIDAEIASQRLELRTWRDNALAEIKRGLEQWDLPVEFAKLQ